MSALRSVGRSNPPVRARPETAGDAIDRLVAIAKRRTDQDFGDKLNSGESFASEYFCKQVAPELGLDISQDYNLPYGLDEK